MTDTLIHGLASTYLNLGCRCDECRAANTAHVRAWRSTPEGRKATREAASVRSQALEALRRRHQAEYRQIVAAIRAGEVVE